MKEIAFTYSIEDEIILNNIQFQLQEGTCILINSLENSAFTVLGAVLGRILPAMELPDIESLRQLYRDYTGKLDFTQDNYPNSVSYVSSDPDRHLMFSEVGEELSAQLGNHPSQAQINTILATFSLSESYLSRKIETLSGGEKMKLTLSLAFALNKDIIVLHGVVPWLDQQGRNSLINQIKHAKEQGKIIFILEQEFHCLQDVIDVVYILHEKTIEQVYKTCFFSEPFNQEIHQQIAKLNRLIKEKRKDDLLLNIKKLSFAYAENTIYQDTSLKLYKNSIYCLNGENGTGKTTLANILFKMVQVEKNKIEFLDKDLTAYSRRELNNRIAYISQFPENQLIWNNIGECRERVMAGNSKFAKSLFSRYFQQADAYPLIYLGFAEMKTLLTIMSLTSETVFLLLDEPTWSLDIESLSTWLDLITEIYEQMNITIFIISHAHGIMPLLDLEQLIISDYQIKKHA
ncbi:MAG TPA: ATP-binding cassette domain-containing protein [Candidatus Cloacimonadota bacterium]|nr:ATP-binding cassette domain-containing protein [Candidatus Cloacimonadota bacterium]HQB41000.1 ATP-binding cassette domain-containing protein [Candidatus Cloacimonadota bacterium]